MDPSFKIRQMTVEDLKLVITWANEEGWKFCETDAQAFFHTDPNGFFIGEVDNIPMCSFAAIKYGDYCFWNFYLVKEEYRGKGYGAKILEHAREYCKDSKILGLDATGPLIKTYQKYGFKCISQTVCFTRKAAGTLKPSLVDLRSIPFELLAEYDLDVFGYSRKRFLELLLEQRSSYALGALKDNKLIGFGILRKHPGEDVYTIGPLSADDQDTATDLFDGLQSYIVDKEVYATVSDANLEAMEIIDKQNWTHVDTYSRMHARGTPKMDITRQFACVDEIS